MLFLTSPDLTSQLCIPWADLSISVGLSHQTISTMRAGPHWIPSIWHIIGLLQGSLNDYHPDGGSLTALPNRLALAKDLLSGNILFENEAFGKHPAGFSHLGGPTAHCLEKGQTILSSSTGCGDSQQLLDEHRLPWRRQWILMLLIKYLIKLEPCIGSCNTHMSAQS